MKGWEDIFVNIIVGVISGIIATLITNSISQYFNERRTIDQIQAKITDFVRNEVDKYEVNTNGHDVTFKLSSEEYQQIKNSFEKFYTEIQDLTILIFFHTRKSHKVLRELADIKKMFYINQELNVLDFKKYLQILRDTL